MGFASGDGIMQRDRVAYERGATEARREAAAGRVRLFSGAPSEGWGRDLAETLRSRFGIEVIFTSCLVTEESLSFEEGHNAAIEAHVDGIWGKGSLADAFADVQRRRQERYDAWVAENAPTKESSPS